LGEPAGGLIEAVGEFDLLRVGAKGLLADRAPVGVLGVRDVGVQPRRGDREAGGVVAGGHGFGSKAPDGRVGGGGDRPVDVVGGAGGPVTGQPGLRRRDPHRGAGRTVGVVVAGDDAAVHAAARATDVTVRGRRLALDGHPGEHRVVGPVGEFGAGADRALPQRGLAAERVVAVGEDDAPRVGGSEELSGVVERSGAGDRWGAAALVRVGGLDGAAA
jgi:hypothetical protein